MPCSSCTFIRTVYLCLAGLASLYTLSAILAGSWHVANVVSSLSNLQCSLLNLVY